MISFWVEDFKVDESGKKVSINGIDARFIPWANHTRGKYLRWIQVGTYVEMDSGELTKGMMIELAKGLCFHE